MTCMYTWHWLLSPGTRHAILGVNREGATIVRVHPHPRLDLGRQFATDRYYIALEPRAGNDGVQVVDVSLRCGHTNIMRARCELIV